MKKGKIRISEECYYNNYVAFYPFMKDYEIESVSYSPRESLFYISGTHPLFNEIKEGDRIPFYDVFIIDNIVTVKLDNPERPKFPPDRIG